MPQKGRAVTCISSWLHHGQLVSHWRRLDSGLPRNEWAALTLQGVCHCSYGLAPIMYVWTGSLDSTSHSYTQPDCAQHLGYALLCRMCVDGDLFKDSKQADSAGYAVQIVWAVLSSKFGNLNRPLPIWFTAAGISEHLTSGKLDTAVCHVRCSCLGLASSCHLHCRHGLNCMRPLLWHQ